MWLLPFAAGLLLLAARSCQVGRGALQKDHHVRHNMAQHGL